MGILSSTHPDITVNNPAFNLGTIPAGNASNATYSVTVDPACAIGTVVDLTYFTYSGPYADQKTFFPDVGLIVEDWETGDFTRFSWNFSGDAPWVIDTSNQYEGNYCSRSGDIGNSNSSVLYVTLEVLVDDTISFFRKTSSENGYDYLRFYIDNVQKGQWAGEKAWERFAYPVNAGLHTFKWEYSKDYYMSSGDDCAWVDFIEFPPINIPSLDAGVYKIYNIPAQSGLHDIRVDIKNFGLDALVSATINWEVDGNAGTSYVWNGNLPTNGIDGPLTIGNYNFADGWHNIRTWTTSPNGSIDEFNFNDTIEADMYFTFPISTFPYCESFENDIGKWEQATNDDFDWTRHSGSTQSGTTGPSNAYDGSYYMYTESSNPRIDGDEAFFITDFDFISLNNPQLEFYYHMYGDGMGTLHVDIFDSVWILDFWSLSDNQGDEWFQQKVNLAPFANKSDITIRFRGEVGNGSGNTWQSDMAIDLVCVHDFVPIYCIPYSGCTNGDGIEDFTLTNINHLASGCSPGGYGDFTNMQANLMAGGTYPVSISSNYGDQNVSLWIDLNDNYFFDANERLISDMNLTNAGTTYTDNINIPASAANGAHRMRVRGRWNQTSVNPCDTFTFGETHDYMAYIIPDTTLVVNAYPDTSICVGDTVTLYVSATGIGAPFTYLWNDGNTSPSIMVTPLNTTTYTVTVTDSFGNTSSDNVHVIVNPLPNIVFHPDNAASLVGGTAIFRILAYGNLSFQWQVTANSGLLWTDLANNTTYSGVNTDTLTITNVQQYMDNYYYRCIITNNNSCSDVSDGGRLFVLPVHTVITEADTFYGCLDTVVVTIRVKNFIDVASFVLIINYNDTTHLTYLGHQNVHPLLSSMSVNTSSGQIHINWNNGSNLTFGDDNMLELVFLPVVGGSAIDFDMVPSNYYSETGYQYPDNYFNGAVTTFNCSSIAGKLTYLDTASTPFTNTSVYAYNIAGYNQGSTITGATGDYLFPILPVGSYSIIANISKNWGGVNASDALMIMMHFAGMTTLTGLPLDAADVDVSGFVNTVDALMCAQRFVGMINAFPSGDWAQDIDTLAINGSTPLNYDFNGLCFGDVNCSYVLPTVKVEPLLSLDKKGIQEVNVNENIVIPLSVNKEMKINAISLILSYPAESLNFKKLDLKANHGTLIYNDLGGEIRISWYSTNSIEIQESDVLLSLVFSPKLSGFPGLNNSFLSLNPLSELADEQAKTINSAKLYIPELINTTESDGEFYLGQNYPNPFNNNTEIEYTLVESGKVSLDVYNTLGEKVDNIINNKLHAEGSYQISFDASKLSPGMYYYRMTVDSESDNYSKTRSMIVVME